jgi:TonB family protein
MMGARSFAVTAFVLAIVGAVACQRSVQEAGPLPEEEAELSQLCDRPVDTPYTVKPVIKDQDRALRIVLRNYTKALQDAGIGGTVYVWVCIDTSGRVRNALVEESSGNRALDAAALASAREMEFTPARNNDEVVPVWIHFPILFEVIR